MSKYSMSSAKDLNRLEKQNIQKQYSLEDELQYLKFNENDCVLDAGCGSGLVTRSIANNFLHKNLKYEACDYSDVAVLGATKSFELKGLKVKIFKSSVDKIDKSDNYYDKIVCRYVFEHLHDPESATKEFNRVLKPGGEACLIDVEGMVFNLFTQNNKLNEYLEILKKKFKFDLFIGRRLTHLLSNAGFQNIEWHASTMEFNTQEERNLELQNYELRFNLARAIIIEALGSEEIFNEFVQLYLEEASNIENTLYYTKFIVFGTKIKV